MRRLSKAFLTVSAILSFVGMGLYLIGAVVFFIVGSPLVANKVAEQGGEGAAIGYAAGMYTAGAIFVVVAIMALLSGIFSNKAKRTQVKGDLVTAIVFSVISCTWLGVAGGAVGLVQNLKEQRADRRKNIVDAQ